jgi:hypothetical protein
MFYRIFKSPPGYPPDQQYMASAYETLAYDSSTFWLATKDGRRMVATVEDARAMLPAGARQLPFEVDHQFLELWEE